MKKSIKERLLNLSVDSGKCRLWVGATSGDGYGWELISYAVEDALGIG